VEPSLAIEAIDCFLASAAFLMAAAACFVTNQKYRGEIDRALAAASGGEALKVPERKLPSYDARYLEEFIAVAAQQNTSFGRSALDVYMRPTLLWIDVGFAVFYAAFVAFL
jgi:hypothetical protein